MLYRRSRQFTTTTVILTVLALVLSGVALTGCDADGSSSTQEVPDAVVELGDLFFGIVGGALDGDEFPEEVEVIEVDEGVDVVFTADVQPPEEAGFGNLTIKEGSFIKIRYEIEDDMLYEMSITGQLDLEGHPNNYSTVVADVTVTWDGGTSIGEGGPGREPDRFSGFFEVDGTRYDIEDIMLDE